MQHDTIITPQENTKQTYYLYHFLNSILFGFGYIMVLLHGYYHLHHFRFTSIGRTDLIARIGFLAHINAKFFYPTAIISLGLILWSACKDNRDMIFKRLFWCATGLIIPAIFLYGDIYIQLLFQGPKEKWTIGLGLLTLSAIIFKRKLKS